MYRVAKVFPMKKVSDSISVPFIDVIEVADARAAYEYAALQNREYCNLPDLRGIQPIYKHVSTSGTVTWSSPTPTSTPVTTPDDFPPYKFIPYNVNDFYYSIRAVTRNVNVDPDTGEHDATTPIFAFPSYDYMPIEIATYLCKVWNDTHPVRGAGALTDPVTMTYFPMQAVE